MAAAPVARPIGRGVASLVGELGTHTGGGSLRTAARAGYEGGQTGQAFRESMRGLRPVEDVVSEAQNAVRNIRLGRAADYRRGMADISRDATVLDFKPIDKALSQAVGIKRYKGQPIGKATKTADEIKKQTARTVIVDIEGISFLGRIQRFPGKQCFGEVTVLKPGSHHRIFAEFCIGK